MRKKIFNSLQWITVIVIVVCLIFSSCKKDQSETAPDMGLNYFPFNVGHWISYQVDSIYYDDFTSSSDTFHYQEKEVYESIFTDISGHPTMRIERYRKDNDSIGWYIKDIWYANKDNFKSEKVEENVRFVKLIFAVEKGKKWNGNAYNTLGEQTYKYLEIDKPNTFNGLSFDSTLTILQADEQIMTSTQYQKEVFARNVGLIYKKYTKLNLKLDGSILSGVDYSYTIISWGN